MYHHSDRKNRLFFIGYIPIQSIRFFIPKLPCGGGSCSRIISCLQRFSVFLSYSLCPPSTRFQSPMQASMPPNGNMATGPLRRLEINAAWESKLVWGPLQFSPPRSPSQVPSSPAPPSDALLSCPEKSSLYPVHFDFGEDYPKQEWELFFPLFCPPHSLHLS